MKSNLVASVQYGDYFWWSNYLGYSPDIVPTEDLVTLRLTGQPLNVANVYDSPRHHPSGLLSWYKPGGFLGNHEIKTGFDLMPSEYAMGLRDNVFPYLLQFSNGAPFQVLTYNIPTLPREKGYVLWDVRDRQLDDRTQAHACPRHPLRAGQRVCAAAVPRGGRLRGGQVHRKVPLATWNSFAPRLSAVYDLSGNGRTAVKGGWARFDYMHDMSDAIPANPLANVTTTWRWRDTNGNKLWDAERSISTGTGPTTFQRPGPAALYPISMRSSRRRISSLSRSSTSSGRIWQFGSAASTTARSRYR